MDLVRLQIVSARGLGAETYVYVLDDAGNRVGRLEGVDAIGWRSTRRENKLQLTVRGVAVELGAAVDEATMANLRLLAKDG